MFHARVFMCVVLLSRGASTKVATSFCIGIWKWCAVIIAILILNPIVLAMDERSSWRARLGDFMGHIFPWARLCLPLSFTWLVMYSLGWAETVHYINFVLMQGNHNSPLMLNTWSTEAIKSNRLLLFTRSMISFCSTRKQIGWLFTSNAFLSICFHLFSLTSSEREIQFILS